MIATRPTPSLSDVQVDEGIVLDARLLASVLRMAGKLPEGSFGRINADGRDYYVHALPGGVWKLRAVRGTQSLPWGPTLWKEIHEKAKNWSQGKEAFTQYLYSLAPRLPCGECRQHWLTYLVKNPVENPYDYTVVVHNAINKRLGKLHYASSLSS